MPRGGLITKSGPGAADDSFISRQEESIPPGWLVCIAETPQSRETPMRNRGNSLFFDLLIVFVNQFVFLPGLIWIFWMGSFYEVGGQSSCEAAVRIGKAVRGSVRWMHSTVVVEDR